MGADGELIIGRSRELRAVTAVLNGADSGSTAVVVEGEAGIGKTTLLDAVARSARYLAASHVKVRRKMTSNSVEVGCVGMHDQRLTVRIISDEYLPVQKLNKYRYEVMSRASPYFGKVDFIYSEAAILLSAGHTYHVRVNSDTAAPRVAKVSREM